MFVGMRALSPTWMPGTTEIRSGGALAGLSIVEPDTWSTEGPVFSLVEHLLIVLDPVSSTGRASYPGIAPRVDVEHVGDVTTRPLDHVRSRQDFETLVNDPVHGLFGCRVRYLVAGVQLYVGRPVMTSDLPTARESSRKDDLSLSHTRTSTSTTLSVAGFVYAENADGITRDLLVHQCHPLNLHYRRPDAGTCAIAAASTLKAALAALLQGSPADLAMQYARAHVRVGAEGLMDGNAPFACVAPGVWTTTPAADTISGVYRVPTLL